jgi:hypothetical protein
MERERRSTTKVKTAASIARRMPQRKKAKTLAIPASDPAAPFWQAFDNKDVRAVLVMFGDNMLESVSAAEAAALFAKADSYFVSRPFNFYFQLLFR